MGHDVHVAIPATGITSRDNAKYEEVEKLRRECREAMEVLGVRASQIYFGEFEDNAMDKYPRLQVIKWFEKIIKDVHPNLILTHHYRCTNIDHQRCHEAVMVATRPNEKRHIGVLCGEVASSTGYLRPTGFEPNLYAMLDYSNVEKKIQALKCYTGEIGEHPHPRSVETIRAISVMRGSESGYRFAEAFMVGRIYRIFDYDFIGGAK